MTQPDELKPCPLCGGKAFKYRYSDEHLDHYYNHGIKCLGCGLKTAPIVVNVDDPAPQRLYDYWNTRSTPDLSRILKLAAAMRWLHTTDSYGPLSEAAKAATETLNALTHEDIQLLEAVLKE